MGLERAQSWSAGVLSGQSEGSAKKEGEKYLD
jgi:hypothetical protein